MSDDLVKRARDCANGLVDTKTDRGDLGIFDDLADRIEELEAANRGLVRLSNAQSKMLDAEESRANGLEAKLAMAVAALEFYGDKNKWIREVPYLGSEIDADYGDIARTTLAELTSSVAANNEVKGGNDGNE